MPGRRDLAVGLVLLTALAGCASEPGGGQRSLRGAAALALLGDNRLVKISLPQGRLEAEVRVGPQPLRAPGAATPAGLGRLLDLAPDGRTVFALVRAGSGRADRVAVIDAASLEIRRSYALRPGIRYKGLLVGASGTLYAYGDQPVAGGQAWNVALTTTEARTGARQRSVTVRAAEQLPGVYWGALSEDEQRLVLSYHGGVDGADWFRVSGRRVERCRPRHARPRPRGAGRCLWTPSGRGGHVHGAVAAFEGGFLAATGSSRIVELDRNGRPAREWETGAGFVHLMDFVLDADRSRLLVSACRRFGGAAINSLDLALDQLRRVPRGGRCGDATLAVHEGRVLLAREPDRSGRRRGLALVDLDRPGTSRMVPSTGDPLAAIVLESGI